MAGWSEKTYRVPSSLLVTVGIFVAVGGYFLAKSKGILENVGSGMKSCWCPACGKEYAVPQGDPCSNYECVDCNEPLAGYWCRSCSGG
jgi:hypothetical protein